jgi:hypothetical protein
MFFFGGLEQFLPRGMDAGYPGWLHYEIGKKKKEKTMGQ